MNMLVYCVELPDGAIKQYTVNTITENILSNIDLDDTTLRLLVYLS